MSSLLNSRGSSPRLRGTQLNGTNPDATLRFIPAPAGNTGSVIPSALPRSVHPRACGEHKSEAPSVSKAVGSSPRLRGTQHIRTMRSSLMRFIPAPAGNTLSSFHSSLLHTVHPRACGEHAERSLAQPSAAGSSPRLRGTRALQQPAHFRARFIPAPAGNTDHALSFQNREAVHPRACGEHQGEMVSSASSTGSSPRLRGTPGCRRPAQIWHRFIPAPAGNTHMPGVSTQAHAVHPRACGEHSSGRPRKIRASGSSPRLRGTRRASTGRM